MMKSGAEATAVQTLARRPSASNFAERLDCGAFTAAFVCQIGPHSVVKDLKTA